MSQFSLLRRRRFGPFFATQFLGAFNDNLFKNAIVILFAFSGLSAADADALVNLSAGIFILPFFLFSAMGGQLADKFEKSRLIRIIKAAEIAIMGLAAVGFFTRSVELLLLVLFLMGTQSTMFGPVKYSILPQHLRDEELVGGNGLVEMGTFVAILIGTIAGGLLIAIEPHGAAIVSACVIGLALLGWLSSRRIPVAEAPAPGLRLRYNPLTETFKLIGHAREHPVVFWAIVAISWFWFYGALFLAQFPGYARSFLGGNEQVVTAMLAAFSIGIGVGSILCERMSRGRIELGLVPLGAIGMTLFAVDLFFASPAQMLPPGHPATVGAVEFFRDAGGWRIFGDLTLIGVFGGWFIVPLYTLMQHRSKPEHRSRVIAANNVLNALFMVAAASIAIGLRAAGLTVTELFFATGLANAVVVVGLLVRVPEFAMRFVVWLLSRTLVRVRALHLERGPAEGAALLVCDDIGPLGILALAAAWRRSVRFVVPPEHLEAGLLGFVLRASQAIGWDSEPEEKRRPGDARPEDRLTEALAAGEVACVFRRAPTRPAGRAGALGVLGVSAQGDAGLDQAVKRSGARLVAVALGAPDRARVADRRPALLPALLGARLARVTVAATAPISHDAGEPWSQVRERLDESSAAG